MDFFDAYSHYTLESECPRFYHRWCAISGIAALLGRNYHFEHGFFKVYPNFYTMLIGSPGTRKSTAIKVMTKLVKSTGYETIAANKTSKEKFLVDLAEGFTNLDDNPLESILEDAPVTREVFITSDEFTDFIGAGNIEFISLLTTLWDNLDSYDNRIKTGKSVHIYEPTINILSGNTPSGFATAFPPEIIGQGFLSRMMLIYGEPTGKKITFPKPPNPQETEELIKYLSRIRIEICGAAFLEPDAEILLDKIYQSWQDLEDVRFKSYSTRRFTHLLKLCLVMSASRLSKKISDADVLLANTILAYTESMMPKALGEFGKSKHSDVANKIMQALYEASAPLGIQDLWKIVSTDLEKLSDLAPILMGLKQAEKLQDVGDGKFLPLRKQLEQDSSLVDFSLLPEVNSLTRE